MLYQPGLSYPALKKLCFCKLSFRHFLFAAYTQRSQTELELERAPIFGALSLFQSLASSADLQLKEVYSNWAFRVFHSSFRFHQLKSFKASLQFFYVELGSTWQLADSVLAYFPNRPGPLSIKPEPVPAPDRTWSECKKQINFFPLNRTSYAIFFIPLKNFQLLWKLSRILKSNCF